MAFYSFPIVFVVCHPKLWWWNSNPCYSGRDNKSSRIWFPNSRIWRIISEQEYRAYKYHVRPVFLWIYGAWYLNICSLILNIKLIILQKLEEFFSWTGKDSRAKLLGCRVSDVRGVWSCTSGILTEIGEPTAASPTQNSLAIAKPWWGLGS